MYLLLKTITSFNNSVHIFPLRIVSYLKQSPSESKQGSMSKIQFSRITFHEFSSLQSSIWSYNNDASTSVPAAGWRSFSDMDTISVLKDVFEKKHYFYILSDWLIFPLIIFDNNKYYNGVCQLDFPHLPLDTICIYPTSRWFILPLC